METNNPEFNKLLRAAQWAVFLLAVFLLVQTLGSLKGLKDSTPAHNVISVSGEGEAIAVPDVAVFSFSVSADAPDVSAAQAQVTAKMNPIIEALEGMGIEERDIKTTDYSAYPKYVSETSVCSPTYCPPSRGSVQDGYTASHSISVKVRNTADAGKALSLVGEMGATGLSGISFTVDDPDMVIEEARAEAIADAKEKAKTLSKDLGVRLGHVVNFYDNSGGMPYYGVGMGGDMEVAVRNTAAPAPDLPMGENKVRINVTVVYEIR